MKRISHYILVAAAAVFFLSSCRPDERVTPVPAKGSVNISVMNVANNEPLQLGGKYYTNANGDSIQITHFNYYISNIVLNGTDSSYTETYSYHLLQADSVNTLSFDLKDVPNGTYNSITFMIGVDSLHNVSGAQTDALDPINGMFWNWKTGYIMAKMEGFSPQSKDTLKRITYHIGGFSGENKGIRTVTLPLIRPLHIVAGTQEHIHMNADAMKWFKPAIVNVNTFYYTMMVSQNSKMIADNYANMFTLYEVLQ